MPQLYIRQLESSERQKDRIFVTHVLTFNPNGTKEIKDKYSTSTETPLEQIRRHERRARIPGVLYSNPEQSILFDESTMELYLDSNANNNNWNKFYGSNVSSCIIL